MSMTLTENFSQCKDSYINIEKNISEDDYKFIIFLVSKMNTKSSRIVRIKSDTYSNLFNSGYKLNSEDFKVLADKLIKKSIKIEKDYNKFILINWFSSVSYSKNILEIRFNYDLVPFLIKLKSMINKNLKTEENHKLLKPYNNFICELSQNKAI